MICPYCQTQTISLASSYNISNVKQRFIPTYYHTQIFAPIQANPVSKIRCTPTFHSQIFTSNTKRQMMKKTTHKAHYKRPSSQRQVVYKNGSKGKKQQHFYNKRGNCNYRSRQLWYDSSKQDLFKQLQGCGQRDYSHERKQIDLSSNPIFGGTNINYVTCKYSNQNPQILAVSKELEDQKNKIEDKMAQERAQQQTIDKQGTKEVESKEQPLKIKPNEPVKQSKNTIQAIHKNTIAKQTTNPYNRTIVEGSPCFTVIRKRNW